MLSKITFGVTSNLVAVAEYLTGYRKSGTSDGVYLSGFLSYMQTWQKVRGLQADGIIGEETWTAIANCAPTCSTAKNARSQATRALQLLLDGASLTVDGIFGKKTKNAVAAFQASAGLSADGICGPKTWLALIIGTGTVKQTQTTNSTTTASGFKQPVNYKQHDSRWGSKMYSGCNNPNQTMANSACGPTAMADIVATLADPSVTPYTLALLSMKWGTRNAPSGGTDGKFFGKVAAYYGFEKMVTTTSLATLKACLDAGGYAVCHMGKGYWTTGGHFICAWKYDSDYIYCNDPSSPTSKRKTERTKQEQSQFKKERKGNYYCFYPQIRGKKEDIKQYILNDAQIDVSKLKSATAGTVDNSANAQKSVVVADSSKAIIDISKHDGKIDFEALKPHASLVIARASLGSDPDERFPEYAAEMNRLGIPFGVYCYSYARDSVKGVDEAAKLRGYTKAYDPLFYVMDIEEECVTQLGIKAFAGTIRAIGGKPVGAYVAHHRYDEYKFDELRSLFDFVWIPRYAGNDTGEPTGKMPDYPCDLWQYTEKGKIEGISGYVDKNSITGQGKSLAWFVGGETK